MIVNPDNPADRLKPVKGTERPEGVANKEKFQEVYGVYERKKTKEELAKEWEEAKKAGKKAEGKKEGHEAVVEASVNKPVSLFDLAKEPKEEGEALTLIPDKRAPKKALSAPTSLFELASLRTPIPENSKYVREQPDLSNVDFMAKAVAESQAPKPAPFVQASPAEAPPPPRAVDRIELQKVIDQIVKHLYQIETKGEVSTLIVLGDEKGVFKGVSIKISEVDTSKGQLNLTIDNLLPEAKVLVDKHANVLLEALERKGYQVQQFIATSAIENPRLESVATGQQEKREHHPQKQREGQPSPEKDKEEE